MEQSGAESDEKEKLVWPFWINGRFAAPRLGGGFEWTRGRDGCAKVAVRALLRERRESANLFPQPFGHGHETAVVEVPHANETPEGIHRPPIAFSRERRVHRRSLEQTTLVDDELFALRPGFHRANARAIELIQINDAIESHRLPPCYLENVHFY